MEPYDNYFSSYPPPPAFPSSSSTSPSSAAFYNHPPPQLPADSSDQWTFEDLMASDLFQSPPPPVPPAEFQGSSSCVDQWTFEENKTFENALAELGLDDPDLFENIQIRVPGKTLWQIKVHFDELCDDIDKIENGVIPVPDYKTTTTSNRRSSHPRKKGTPWKEEEHKLFLEGLEKYGKGDWKSISRYCVVTRTPTQVASHAQKYFLRLQNAAESEQNANAGEHHPWDQNNENTGPTEGRKRKKYKKRSKKPKDSNVVAQRK